MKPLLLAALLLAGAAEDEQPLNRFNDPFEAVSSDIADCPEPRGPRITAAEMRVQAHSRAERGTTCWLRGECSEPNAFRYDATPAPTLTSVSPNRGGTGGCEVTLEGTNFLKETSVLFDGKPVKSVKFISKTTIEVKSPPGDNGKMVDVVVRNPDGKEAVQKRAFMYDSRYG